MQGRLPLHRAAEVKRRYGRIQPAPLPAHRMLGPRVSVLTLPTVVDLRPNCGPIKDQGQEGSCTGHAFSSGIEWVNRAYLKRQPILSPQFFYAEELIADGNFPDDDGSDGTTGCNIAVGVGCCEASLYPYVAGDIERPTPAQMQNAVEYTLGAYHGLTGSATALSVIGDPTPWPVEIGFTVYDSFESDTTATTGIYNPQPRESVLGGHEVLMVGYDVGPTPTLRPVNCPPAALIQNSWGSGWGLSGFFWMALAVLDDTQTDLKIG